ncbi:MAG TPA: Ger(x)C family spore germination protein [Syntrophomonas sp.]|nr:Ger(x)C family spore germination protein [Syntrophomonas sp.]
MQKIILFLMLTILLFSSAGCWDLQEIDDKTVTTAIGYDLEGNNRLRFSSLYTVPSLPGETSSVSQAKPVLTISSDYSGAMAARRTMLSLSKVPEYAHIRSIVMGDNLLKNNLPLMVDLLTRNRNFSPNTSLLVSVDSHPEEILALVNDSDQSLQMMVVFNELQLGIYVPVTIYDFIFKLLTPGIEPVMPQITIEAKKPDNQSASFSDQVESPSAGKKKMVLHHTAVFKKDKKVGFLNEYESRGLRWLNSRTKTGGVIVIKSPSDASAYTALEILRFHSNTRALVDGGQIKMQINIKARLAMNENTGGVNNITKDVLGDMEQTANQEIARQIKSCIRKSQSLNSDVLGWGLLLLQYEPDTWKQVKGDWNHIYPRVPYEVTAETSIIHTYLSK